jgi:hypothetical protein
MRNILFTTIVFILLRNASAMDFETEPDQINKASESQSKPETIGPWNLTELKKSPEFRWISQKGPVHSLQFKSEKYQGHKTEVFAFYASPATLGIAKPGQKFPGVVLIHGGGGTAFVEWAWLWAKRGYAAIAMDLSGSRPIDPIYNPESVPVPNQAASAEKRTRLANGGPDQGHSQKFDTIGGDVSDDWPYHAVSNVVRSHSLLRSFPEVISRSDRRPNSSHRHKLGWIHDMPGRIGGQSISGRRARLWLWIPVRRRVRTETSHRQSRQSTSRLDQGVRPFKSIEKLPGSNLICKWDKRRPLPIRQLPEKL